MALSAYGAFEILRAKRNKLLIELLDLNNQINISFAAWVGSGTIRLKNKKDSVLFKTVINDIKIYCKENRITILKKIPLFLMLFGVFYIVLAVCFFLFMSEALAYIY
jgi:hypothetical protein